MRIAPVGKHLVQAYAIKLGPTRDRGHSLGFRDIAKRQEKRVQIVLFYRCIDVFSGFRGVLKRLQWSKVRITKFSRFLRVITLGRLLYGLILLGAGLAIFKVIGKNPTSGMLRLIDQWHIDSHFYYIHWLLQKVSMLSRGLLSLLAVENFSYSVLAFVEAAALVLRKRWAYWLVIGDTASMIPIEIFQICKEFGWINLILLGYYFPTVVYLFFSVKKTAAGNNLQRIIK
jgi:uncharacterized membrane protein (DUF2068 family)